MGSLDVRERIDLVSTVLLAFLGQIFEIIAFMTGFEWLAVLLAVVTLLITAVQVWFKWNRTNDMANPNQQDQSLIA